MFIFNSILRRPSATALISAVLLACAPFAHATDVMCEEATNPTKNYMLIDDAQVSSCLASGAGNINGNLGNVNGSFVNSAAGMGYTLVSTDASGEPNPFNIVTSQTAGGSFSEGTWSLDSDFWNTHTAGAIGFKFGTGNKPDEWFVFELVSGETQGDWRFENVFEMGGGLSHTNLYAAPVPLPAAAWLFLTALSGLVLARRRRATV